MGQTHNGTKRSGDVLSPTGDLSDPDSPVARFSAAESRLYPLALADTEAFERATSLVSLVAVELRGCAGIAEVLEQLEGIVAQLPESAAAAGIDTTDLPRQLSPMPRQPFAAAS